MKTALLLTVLVALGVTWSFEKLTAARLVAEIDAQSEQQRELGRLQHERDRLRGLQPGDDESAALSRAATEHAQLQHELARQEATRATQPPALPLGEWISAHEWRNRGQATPHAAVETALWAAAGGDVSALKNLLSLPEPTRVQAEALLARIPDGVRSPYASAEDLIAAFTIKRIPVGEAQLVWFNESTPDDATVCVFLKNPPTEPGSVDLTTPKTVRGDARSQPPPDLPAADATSATYLSLHRDETGWRLIVPPSAVARIAKELAVGP